MATTQNTHWHRCARDCGEEMLTMLKTTGPAGGLGWRQDRFLGYLMFPTFTGTPRAQHRA